MAATREIKTTITLDGVRKFDAELKEAGRGMRVMGSEMKRAAAEFDASGDRMEFLGSKSRILGDQIAQQERIIEALTRAVDESAAAYGDASARTDGYRIKLNNAQAALAKMERELRDTDREMEELGRDAQKVGRQIESGITDSAEEAERSLEDMIKAMQEDIGSIQGSAAVQAIGTVGNAITGAWGALDSFAESSRDYNRQLSFLEQNAMSAGQDYEIVKGLLLDVAALTGDMDGAVEGVSNLLAAGFDTSEAELAIESLAGAVITFPETMKFENLAESLQETIRTGEATGAFSELLGRMGLNVEDFNKAMQAATTEEEKQQVALSYLNSMGLRPVAESYKETNQDLIDATKSTDNLSLAWAGLARTVDTYLTPIRDGIADAVNWINLLMTDSQAALNQAAGATKDLAEDITKTDLSDEEFASGMMALANSVMAGSSGLVGTTDALSVFYGGAKGEAEKRGTEAGKASGTRFAHAYVEGFEEAKQEAELSIMGMPMTLPTEAQMPGGGGWGEGLSALWQMMTGGAQEGGTQAGETAITAMETAMNESVPAAEESAKASGENVTAALANGITENGSLAISAAVSVVNGINAAFSQIAVPSLTGMSSLYNQAPSYQGVGGSASMSGVFYESAVNLSVNLDGRQIATATAPYMAQSMGRTANRAAAIG